MKVLMISGDKNLLTPGAEAHKRLELQRAQVEKLDVFVWPQVHSLKQIFRAARSEHYDVVTAQDPFWRGHIAWHAARRCRAQLNIQVHTDFNAEPLWKRLWGRVQLARASSVRVVSERIRQEIAGLTKAPISVLPVFVDLEAFKTLSPEPHEGKTLLWIGRFEKEKNPLQALIVFRSVLAAIPAKLVMLGEGTLAPALKEKARDLAVVFPGWQDTKSFLRKADVVFSTSQYESYGASIIEALAASVAVVAPDVGIAKEAGAIVVPRDKLPEAIIDVLRHNKKGELKLDVLSASEWAKRWKETLA